MFELVHSPPLPERTAKELNEAVQVLAKHGYVLVEIQPTPFGQWICRNPRPVVVDREKAP